MKLNNKTGKNLKYSLITREDGKRYEKGNDDREIDKMSSLWKEDKGQL